MAFAGRVVPEVVLADNSGLDMVVPEVAFVGRVVGKLECSIFVDLAIVESLDSLVG